MYVPPSGQLERWVPRSEGDILAGIERGLLAETHYMDIKREVEATSRGRKELARDIASFAIDGGTLLIGIEEDKENRTWIPAPQQLDGLGERVEQIATSQIDPPVYVSCVDLPSGADERTGYLVITIAQSGQSPHMVDGIYYGRGDRTRSRLSDAEVVRFHARRHSAGRLTEAALEEEELRDPVLLHERKFGHLHAVAHPVLGRPGMGRELLTSQNGLFSRVLAGDALVPAMVRDWSPTLRYASNFAPRAQGCSMHSGVLSGPGRTMDPEYGYGDPEGGLLDIEFREDGGIRLLVGRLVQMRGHDGDHSGTRVAADGLAIAYAFRLLAWSRDIAQATEYYGPWAFGVRIGGLRGALSSRVVDDFTARATTYDAETYQETTESSRDEMTASPGLVVGRLIGRLLRGLGSQEYWRAEMSS